MLQEFEELVKAGSVPLDRGGHGVDRGEERPLSRGPAGLRRVGIVSHE